MLNQVFPNHVFIMKKKTAASRQSTTKLTKSNDQQIETKEPNQEMDIKRYQPKYEICFANSSLISSFQL